MWSTLKDIHTYVSAEPLAAQELMARIRRVMHPELRDSLELAA